MDEQTDRSSSSASDFVLVRGNNGHRPEQASDVCWIKKPFLQKIKSFSSSWLTVSLLVLLFGLTIEYKRVSDINQLMSVQLKDLRQDYDQLKMHDTNQQLQILAELRALRDCERPKTIDEAKKIEIYNCSWEPEAEHVDTQIKEETKTTVEPQPMDIQEAIEVKPIEEPIVEQTQNGDLNEICVTPLCVSARKTRNCIKEFSIFVVSSCYYVLSHPIAVTRSIWRSLTIEMILTLVAGLWVAKFVLLESIEERRVKRRDFSYIDTIFFTIFFGSLLGSMFYVHFVLHYIRLVIFV